MPFTWKRFWCSRTGNILLSDDGFLLDPDTDYGRIANSEVVPLESILHIPCLALLGEPGIGKTHTLRAEVNRTKALVRERGDLLLDLDLRAYSSEDRLCRALFESADFKQWLKKRTRLHLFLDSLDEGSLAIETLGALLVEEIRTRQLPTSRLSLRIACRTLEWRSDIEAGLQNLWGQSGFAAYELAPLRRSDVAAAARDSNLDADAFLLEIDRTSASPLAIRPLSLKFLLDQYARVGHLPRNMTDLYRSGCEVLCTELSERRRLSVHRELLSTEQRLHLAGRLAAVTLLSNRGSISTRPSQDSDSCPISECAGGEEGRPDNAIPVGEAAIRETLNTGLFTSRGPGLMGWAHQSYAEFLAAWRLTQLPLEAQQRLAFLLTTVGDTSGVIPQLRGTAAWMAGMDANVFTAVLSLDPPLLLASDLQSVDEAFRAQLVQRLVEGAGDNRSPRLAYDWRSKYARLQHTGLASQLRAYIEGPWDQKAQEFAIDVADACNLAELSNLLAGLALDRTKLHGLRVTAARAVANMGTSSARQQLLPLTDGTDADPAQDLKGLALRANWPRNLSPAELFAKIVPPADPHYFGGYFGFLHELSRSLRPLDLPAALTWASAQGRRHFLSHSIRELLDSILVKALESCSEDASAARVANTIMARLRLHEPWVEEHGTSRPASELLEDQDRRQLLLQAAVELPADRSEARLLGASVPELVRADDVHWLLRRLAGATPQRRCTLSALVGRAADLTNSGHCDAIITASESYPELREVFASLLGAVQLGSPEAASIREFYYSIGPGHRGKVKALLTPSPKTRIRQCLKDCATDVVHAWPALIAQLTLDSDSTHYHDDWRPDVTSLPGWLAASAATKDRIVACAARYLRFQNPGTRDWIHSNRIDHRVIAGYHAIVLLAGTRGPIAAATLRRWMPAIVNDWHQKQDELHGKILAHAHAIAPRVFCSTLANMIARDIAVHRHVFVTRAVTSIGGRDIENVLLRALREVRLSGNVVRELADDLLKRGNATARARLLSIATRELHRRGSARDRGKAAALALLADSPGETWRRLWPVVRRSRSYTRAILLAWVGDIEWRRGGSDPLAGMSEQNLTELFIALVREFPFSTEAEPEVPSVRPIDEGNAAKTLVLTRLVESGTPAALAGLRQLHAAFPELIWLARSIRDCEERSLAISWSPAKPAEVVSVLISGYKVLVQTGKHLVELLLASLGRLQAELRGETPLARFLWNESDGRWRPKSENDLSDYIAKHFRRDLRDRGLIANREVEVRRHLGSGIGERTDIHITAFRTLGRRRQPSPLTVIVEVKGCWNGDIPRSMETQLIGQYMKPAGHSHGLYLVGWYSCESWDTRDPRRARARRFDMAGLIESLTNEAVALSSRHMLDVRATVLDARID
jgi:hypothetical protein